MMNLRVFIQARMGSSRFPGKMLASLAGRPVISHLVHRLAQNGLADRIVLLTSSDSSDDALAEHAERYCHVPVFRGDQNNVVRRFQDCLRQFPANWIVRISGDSPVIDSGLVDFVTRQIGSELDLVSNVVRRTFPPGQSVECIQERSLLDLSDKPLTDHDREHVTPYFYRNADDYRIRSVVSSKDFSSLRFAVDTPADLDSISAIVEDRAGHLPNFERYAMVET